VVLGAVGCPVVVVGNEIWQLSAGRLVQTLENPGANRFAPVLSDNGRWFAAALRPKGVGEISVVVWSTETGKRVLEVPVQEKHLIGLLTFSRDKCLLIGLGGSEQIDVWDVESGQQAKPVAVPIANGLWESGQIAFTPDGAYFAIVAHDDVLICATATGRKVTTMATPGAPTPTSARGKTRAQIQAEAREAALDRVFVYAWIHGLKFSPDGQELAAVTTHRRSQIVVWNRRGALVFYEPLRIPLESAAFAPPFQWLPDGSGWLIGGHLYDRQSKRVVVKSGGEIGPHCVASVIDKDHLFGRFRRQAPYLEVRTIPWETIRRSVAKADGGASEENVALPIVVQ
jgi:WD40 repeat protein